VEQRLRYRLGAEVRAAIPNLARQRGRTRLAWHNYAGGDRPDRKYKTTVDLTGRVHAGA
jgi:hypothetical protein